MSVQFESRSRKMGQTNAAMKALAIALLRLPSWAHKDSSVADLEFLALMGAKDWSSPVERRRIEEIRDKALKRRDLLFVLTNGTMDPDYFANRDIAGGEAE